MYMQDFHKQLIERRKSVDKLLRNTSAAAAATAEMDEKDETSSTSSSSESKKKMCTLQQKWNMLWRLSLDMKKKLQDNFATLLQVDTILQVDTLL